MQSGDDKNGVHARSDREKMLSSCSSSSSDFTNVTDQIEGVSDKAELNESTVTLTETTFSNNDSNENEDEEKPSTSPVRASSSQEDAEYTDHRFSANEMRDLKEAFDVFDRANEGVITPGKLGSVLRSLGEDFTEAEIQDLIFAVDENGNGTIEFPEFVNVFAMSNRGATRKTRAGQDGEMRAAFRVFDRDDDGFVTMRDLHGLLSRLGTTVTEEEAESMILAASGNDREKVSYEDFAMLFFGGEMRY